MFYNIINGIILIFIKDKIKISKYNSICVEGVGIRVLVVYVEGVWSMMLVVCGLVGIIVFVVVGGWGVFMLGVDKLNFLIVFKKLIKYLY